MLIEIHYGAPKKRMKLANISKHFVVCFVTDLFLYIIFICRSICCGNMLIVCSTRGEL